MEYTVCGCVLEASALRNKAKFRACELCKHCHEAPALNPVTFTPQKEVSGPEHSQLTSFCHIHRLTKQTLLTPGPGLGFDGTEKIHHSPHSPS